MKLFTREKYEVFKNLDAPVKGAQPDPLVKIEKHIQMLETELARYKTIRENAEKGKKS